jgi:hypothetical protein
MQSVVSQVRVKIAALQIAKWKKNANQSEFSAVVWRLNRYLVDMAARLGGCTTGRVV